VLALWVLVLAVWTWRLWSTGTTPTESLQAMIDVSGGAWWAIPVFITVYAVRPLVLFPASVLTVAAGIMFGPVVGVGVATVGSNLSALVAFQVAKTFTPATVAATGVGTAGLLSRWAKRLRERSFATVMVMRLAFLPYDLVNFAAGFLRINLGAFLAATALGSLPGTVSFVLAGASVERLDAGVAGFDPRVFLFSVALFAVSIVVAKALQRREAAARPGGAGP
jgi:uncharacterized membrane protein YdjX (TVP38/TMEM64 family)